MITFKHLPRVSAFTLGGILAVGLLLLVFNNAKEKVDLEVRNNYLMATQSLVAELAVPWLIQEDKVNLQRLSQQLSALPHIETVFIHDAADRLLVVSGQTRESGKTGNSEKQIVRFNNESIGYIYYFVDWHTPNKQSAVYFCLLLLAALSAVLLWSLIYYRALAIHSPLVAIRTLHARFARAFSSSTHQRSEHSHRDQAQDTTINAPDQAMPDGVIENLSVVPEEQVSYSISIVLLNASELSRALSGVIYRDTLNTMNRFLSEVADLYNLEILQEFTPIESTALAHTRSGSQDTALQTMCSARLFSIWLKDEAIPLPAESAIIIQSRRAELPSPLFFREQLTPLMQISSLASQGNDAWIIVDRDTTDKVLAPEDFTWTDLECEYGSHKNTSSSDGPQEENIAVDQFRLLTAMSKRLSRLIHGQYHRLSTATKNKNV